MKKYIVMTNTSAIDIYPEFQYLTTVPHHFEFESMTVLGNTVIEHSDTGDYTWFAVAASKASRSVLKEIRRRIHHEVVLRVMNEDGDSIDHAWWAAADSKTRAQVKREKVGRYGVCHTEYVVF